MWVQLKKKNDVPDESKAKETESKDSAKSYCEITNLKKGLKKCQESKD